jgi:hypothetical protein
MKKSHIVSGIVVLTILITVAGVTSKVLAADNTNIKTAFGRLWGKPVQKLTDAQKAEMKTKMDAVNAALTAGDYNAWVTAEKAMDANSPMLTKVTANNFSTYVQNYKDREAKMAEQKTKIDAVTAALTAGDYNAWVTAEKAMDANSPLLAKITAENFNRYVEATNLQKQAAAIMTELGVERGGDIGERGHGMRGGFGPGGPGGFHGKE